MPVFGVFPLELDTMDNLVQLVQESEFSTHTEVRDSQEAHFLKYELTG